VDRGSRNGPKCARSHIGAKRLDAGVVELVDAPDSKSGSARSAGSTPATRTKLIRVLLSESKGHTSDDGTRFRGKGLATCPSACSGFYIQKRTGSTAGYSSTAATAPRAAALDVEDVIRLRSVRQ